MATNERTSECFDNRTVDTSKVESNIIPSFQSPKKKTTRDLPHFVRRGPTSLACARACACETGDGLREVDSQFPSLDDKFTGKPWIGGGVQIIEAEVTNPSTVRRPLRAHARSGRPSRPQTCDNFCNEAYNQTTLVLSNSPVVQPARLLKWVVTEQDMEIPDFDRR